MSFTFDPTIPAWSWVRIMVGDTVEFTPSGARAYIFSDEEYTAMYNICTSQFQSAQFYSPPAGRNLPQEPIPWYRIAALALDSMAANKSYLASVVELLDVKLDPSKSAEALRKMAQQYRDTDDNAGAFMIIEQVNDDFSFFQRYWNQVARQQGLVS